MKAKKETKSKSIRNVKTKKSAQSGISQKALEVFLKKVSDLQKTHQDKIKSILKEIEREKLTKVRKKIGII